MTLIFHIFRREDCIDVEVRASGLTKQMEKDLLVEMGIEEDSTDTEEVEENEDENLENEIEKLRLEVDKISEEDSARPESSSKTEDAGTETEANIRDGDVDQRTNVGSTNLDKVPDVGTNSNDDDASDNESVYSHAQSIRSISTAATIAPDVIKRRIKSSLEKRAKRGQSRKLLAKGEASATTRSRRENTDNIKQSVGSGIWGCE